MWPAPTCLEIFKRQHLFLFFFIISLSYLFYDSWYFVGKCEINNFARFIGRNFKKNTRYIYCHVGPKFPTQICELRKTTNWLTGSPLNKILSTVLWRKVLFRSKNHALVLSRNHGFPGAAPSLQFVSGELIYEGNCYSSREKIYFYTPKRS